MATATAQLVFDDRDLCSALLRLLHSCRDVGAAACVNNTLAAAAASHWAALRAAALPLSGTLAHAVGDVATLRAFDAAARAAREQAAWASVELRDLRFVLHVRGADGALLVAAAAQPREVASALRFEEQVSAPGQRREGRHAASLLLDPGCTASLFVERTLRGGGVRVACVFADDARAALHTRDTLHAPQSDSEEEYECANCSLAEPWLRGLCADVLPADALENNSGHVLVFANARCLDGDKDPSDLPLPPLLDTDFGGGNFPAAALRYWGWFAVRLHVPADGDGGRDATSARDVALSLHATLFTWAMDGGAGFYGDTCDMEPYELCELLKNLQWQRA